MQPENIVLKEKDGKQLKIIDFGSAQNLSVNPKIKSMVGTPEFIGKCIAHLPSHSLYHQCTQLPRCCNMIQSLLLLICGELVGN